MLRTDRWSFSNLAGFASAVALSVALTGVCQAQVQPKVFPDAEDLAKQYAGAAKAEQEKVIAQIQQQAVAIEEAVEAANVKRTEAAAAMEQARSTQGAARTKQLEAKKELQAARRELQDLEDAILTIQGPETEYARARAAQDQARDGLDAVTRRVLGLPVRKGTVSDADRQRELARLSASQKAKLRANPDYDAANDRVDDALRAVNAAKVKVLESDGKYQSTAERVAAASEADDEADAQAKAASVEIGRLRQELRTSEKTYSAARKALIQVNRFLASIGALPDPK